MTYRGRVKNGAVVLNETVLLPEGAEVDVVVIPVQTMTADSDDDAEPTLYDTLEPIIGILNDLPRDGSR